eukprot:4322449-Prymnesium_polylepis.1
MAGATLSNLSEHRENRTRMYRAELQIKILRVKGLPTLWGPSPSEPPSPTDDSNSPPLEIDSNGAAAPPNAAPSVRAVSISSAGR